MTEGRLRREKKRLLMVRDADLGPQKRLRLGEAQITAAREVFMAGMAARGFTRAEALRNWKKTAPRAK